MTARLATSLPAFAAAAALLAAPARADDWPVFGHDAARSGVAGGDAISISTVSGLHPRWQIRLGDVVDASPIVVGDRIFATARDGSTWAVDSATGHVVWIFRTTGTRITTATPAYDEGSRLLYAAGVDGSIHRLDPATGRELVGRGFPARVTLAPQTEKIASSLNVANGYLYAQTSGFVGDDPPYVGHLAAIRLTDGATTVFNALCATHQVLIDPAACPQQRAGMWSRGGVVVDPDAAQAGRIYAVTGNGDANPAGGDYGDSILALTPDGARIIASYTPDDAAALAQTDRDLGSSAVALLPRFEGGAPLLAVQGGKDATLRLLDRERLGEPLQRLRLDHELFTAPAVWRDDGQSTWIFLGVEDGVRALRVAVGADGATRLVDAWRAHLDGVYEGSSPAVENGVVFDAVQGALVALDGVTGRRLWAGEGIGPIHWQSPAIAGDLVVVADERGDLTAFSR